MNNATRFYALLTVLNVTSGIYSMHGQSSAHVIPIKNESDFNSDLIQGWNAISAVYLEHKASGDHQGELIEGPYFKKLLTQYSANAKNVLDACTGNGWFALSVLRWNILEKLEHLIGMDISPAMIQTARSQTDDSRVAFICSAIELDTSIPNASIDLIISSNAIDCIYNVETALLKLRQLLKPNGYMILSIRHPKRNAYYVTGNPEGIFTEGSYAEKWPGTGQHEVIRFFRTEDHWDEIFASCGFSIIEKQIPLVSESLADTHPEHYEYYKNKKYPGALIYVLKR